LTIDKTDRFHWRALATSWLTAEEIAVIGAEGFVGRIVLRLLDEVERLGGSGDANLQPALDRLNEVNAERETELLASADARIAQLEAEVQTLRLARGGEPHWLTKDFNVLYRALERLVNDIDAECEVDLGWARAQLARLKPAAEMTEAVCAVEVRAATDAEQRAALETYAETRRKGEGNGT
jgi:hypothetical protein